MANKFLGLDRLAKLLTLLKRTVNMSGTTITNVTIHDGTLTGTSSTSGISFDGSTSNGVLTYKDSDEATVESNIVFNGSNLSIASTGKLELGGASSGQHIYESTDNQLDIDATTLVEVTSPTIELAASTKVDIQSDALSIGENADTDVVVTFNANTSDGTLTWMEDESEFRFNSPTKGKFLHYTQHVFNKNSGTSLIYVPLNSTVDSANLEEFVSWMAPHDGKLLKVLVRVQGYSGNYGGSTVVGLHVNRNSTASTTNTQTLASGSLGTFTFSSSNTFSAGDLLSLSMDVSAIPGDVNLCAIWELDSTT